MTELIPENPIPHIERWLQEHNPDALGSFRELLVREAAKEAVAVAMIFLASVGFAAGREYEHQRSMPTFPPEAEDEELDLEPRR
jgi:hypothetical protein